MSGTRKSEKTNAARLLDKAGIKYELVPYEVDENDLAASHIAGQLGEPIEQVFKTLVLSGDRTGYFVCVVPGNAEVNLKAAAKVSGNKKCDLIPVKNLLGVTGYIRGGCSPVGMKKPFKGQTVVLKDSGLLNKFKGFPDMERVKLEDVVFEKHFEVYSTDQIEARYLLTTAFMERILQLKKLYRGKKIEISFYANKLLLAIDTRENMFEPCSFFKTNLNKKKFDQVFEQFWMIFSIIHVLKLNSTTGL